MLWASYLHSEDFSGSNCTHWPGPHWPVPWLCPQLTLPETIGSSPPCGCPTQASSGNSASNPTLHFHSHLWPQSTHLGVPWVFIGLLLRCPHGLPPPQIFPPFRNKACFPKAHCSKGGNYILNFFLLLEKNSPPAPAPGCHTPVRKAIQNALQWGHLYPHTTPSVPGY